MKSVIMLWFFIVIIFIVLGLGFAYVIQQQQASSAGVKAVEQMVGKYDTVVGKLEAQLKTNSENIKMVQGTVMSSEANRRGLSDKVEGLARQIEEVKAQLGDVSKIQEAAAASSVGVAAPVAPDQAAPSVSAPEAGAEGQPPVELGTIPVEKVSP